MANKYRRNFPDYVKRYKEKTGRLLSEEIKTKEDEEIREDFKKAGLNRPSVAFLSYYRSLMKDPKMMVKRVTNDYETFLATRLGIKTLEALSVINTIILKGLVEWAESGKEVRVSDLLKALELKLKYEQGAGNIKEVEKMLNKIFGEKEDEHRQRKIIQSDKVSVDSPSDKSS